MTFTTPDFENESGQSLPLIYNPSGFEIPVSEPTFQKILSTIEDEEKIKFSMLEVVFVDEETILELNKKHLGLDYVTDILSFRYDEESTGRAIEGSLYCCAPRIVEQASEFRVGQPEEFCRIVIHGMLHLAGYDDHSDAERTLMKQLENRYLETLSFESGT